MKDFEILSKGNKKFKLTVTPTRVTIKLAEGSSPEAQSRVITFFEKVAEQPAMKDAEQSYRGTIQMPEFGSWYIFMETNGKNATTTLKYYEESL